MTKDDIIRMAREAGFERIVGVYKDGTRIVEVPNPELLERFAALVAAAEREACAKLAESTVCDTHLPTGVRIYGTRAAAAIRARTP